MPLSIESTIRLNNGIEMPLLGIGTWRSRDGDEAYRSVRDALEIGYRHIDTASIYGNEESVGRAIRDSKLAREDVFVTTKLWNDDSRSGKISQALEASLKRLGLDQVDLYLVHWPVKEKFVGAYLGLEKLLDARKTRAIGVSNFLVHHLDELAKHASVVPAVNQIEWHPWLQSNDLLTRCTRAGIVVEAWAPLMQGKINDVPELASIAAAHRKTPAQVALRWGLQKDVVMIPKSVKRHRIEENAGLFDFDLSDDQMRRIDALDRGHRFGSHPDTFTF